MKYSSPIVKAVLGSFCIVLLFSINTISQTQPTQKKERTIRYVTNQKKVAKTRPRIRILKRGNIGRIPSNSLSKLKSDDQGLEKIAFNLINQKRFEKGLRKLKWSDKLAGLARQHSENMAKYTFFSHIGLNGRLIDQRAIDFGLKKWKSIGENIAYNKGFEKPADFAVERWMISTTHRDNLLDSRWIESGIGVGITEDGFYYFTQVFFEK